MGIEKITRNLRRPIRRGLCAAFGLALVWLASPGFTQNVPSNTIRLIIPYSPGGSVDIVGRGIAQRYTQRTGKTVVVDNKPGAGGTIGTDAVVRANKDGQTLLLHTGTIAVENAAGKKVPYELHKDLVPITMIANGPFALVVPSDFPAKNFSELIQYAKANPGKLNYSSAGVGTSTHLAMELFKETAGIDVMHVPYKGGAPSLHAVAAGEVQMAFSPLVNARPFNEVGRLRAIATSTQKRTNLWPELPSSLESGLPAFSTSVWYGIFAQAGMPEKVMNQLSNDFRTIVNADETKQWLRTQGLDAVGDTPADFRQKIDKEIDVLQKMLNRTGIKIE